MTNTSFIMLKPDALDRGLCEEVERRLAQHGLVVTQRLDTTLTMDLVKRLYKWDVVHHFDAIEHYLCGRRLPVWMVSGADALRMCSALKSQLRADFALDRLHTLLHCPDSFEDLVHELHVLFPQRSLPL